MSAATVNHVYDYRAPSSLAATSDGLSLALATSGGVTEKQGADLERPPFFFQGALTAPAVTAKALTTLAKVVEARYTMTPQERLAMKDPVVTCGGRYLRFEGFSGCGGVYGRVDLKPGAYDGVVVDQGTTNVDFNAPMRQALARVNDRDRVGFAVGDDEVTLLKGAEQVVEKKVNLPKRWLKGFVEIQAYLARMQPRHELNRIEAIRFLRTLPPKSSSKTTLYLKPVGRILRFSPQTARGAIAINGGERLRLLDPLIPLTQSLRIYAEDGVEASAWELDLGDQTFCLTISPDNYRGFSGEGQVLSEVAQGLPEEVLNRVQGALHWQSSLKPEAFASEWELSAEQMRTALGLLGSRGLVGYDLEQSAYFHRVMPFDLSAVDRMHPRLAGAKKLLADDAVKILSTPDEPVLAEVKGSGVTHRVQQLSDDAYRCTCQWFAKYQGKRGVCKHIIATQIAANQWSEE